MLIATILFIALLAFSIRPKCKFFSNEIYEDGWSFDNTNAIRGLLAVSIILYHLTGNAVLHIPHLTFAYSGIYGVGVFFFLSGYALQLKTTEAKIGGGWIILKDSFQNGLAKYYIRI